MTRTLASIALALALAAMPATAQEWCDEPAALGAKLSQQWGEKHMLRLELFDDDADVHIDIFLNPTTETWTFVALNRETRMACAYDIGRGVSFPAQGVAQ
jgi:hypothetical protein